MWSITKKIGLCSAIILSGGIPYYCNENQPKAGARKDCVEEMRRNGDRGLARFWVAFGGVTGKKTQDSAVCVYIYIYNF